MAACTLLFGLLVVSLALTALSFAAEGEKAPVRIALHVADVLPAARAGEVLCSGIPFARGVLPPSEPMHVTTEGGQALPTQTRVLGQWPDGSVRWLLVQFPADCPAGGEATYYLAAGAPPAPSAPLAVQDEAERVIVDTGALRITVPKTDLTVVGDVELHEAGGLRRVLTGGTPVRVVLTDGTVHSSRGVRPNSI